MLKTGEKHTFSPKNEPDWGNFKDAQVVKTTTLTFPRKC